MLIEICKKNPEWGNSSPCIISLLDMITFQLQPLCSQLCLLQHYRDWLQAFITQHPNSNDAKITDDIATNFTETFSFMQTCLENIGLIAAPKLIKQILKRFPEMSFIRLHEATINIQQMVVNEIKEVLLIFIPRDKSVWLENERVAHEKICESFPSSLDDFKEAIFCYVFGRYTAAVFHAMRVLECCLGSLAKDVELSFDVQQWYDIINQIEKKIKEAQNLSKSLEKSNRLIFLSKAAKEFTYFKDGWRNYVSHRRPAYDGPQALSAINHVKAFMIHLSTELKE